MRNTPSLGKEFQHNIHTPLYLQLLLIELNFNKLNMMNKLNKINKGNIKNYTYKKGVGFV